VEDLTNRIIQETQRNLQLDDSSGGSSLVQYDSLIKGTVNLEVG